MNIGLVTLSLMLILCVGCTQQAASTTITNPTISDVLFIYLDRGVQREDGKWCCLHGSVGIVSGKIQNIGSTTIDGTTITVDWYTVDRSNTFLRSDRQTIYSLAPNEISDFEIYYNGTGQYSSIGYINNVYISNVW